MTALGLLLLFVGFFIIIPAGAMPGSSAARNVRMGDMHMQQTPGHHQRPPTGWKRATIRVLVGLAIMLAGIYFVDIGDRASQPDRDGARATPTADQPAEQVRPGSTLV